MDQFEGGTPVPLSDVIEWARETADLNIVVDKRGLAEEGVALSTPISIKLDDVMLSSVFRLLLEPQNLGFKIEDESGTVIITSRFRQMGRLMAAAYPVADLVVPLPGRFSMPLNEDDRSANALPNVAERKIEFDTLVELIQQTVEPDSWQEVGGPGSVRTNETTLSLVIRQTKEVHEEISDLLDQLRRLQDLQVVLSVDQVVVSEDVVERLDTDLKFEPLSKSESKGFVRLSNAQVKRLRDAGDIIHTPRVTLFNGQACNLQFPRNGDEKLRLTLQPAVSGDRRHVRLAVNSGSSRSKTVSTLPTISSGETILLELNDSAAPSISRVPVAGRPQVFQRVSGERNFVLIQARVIVSEDEEVIQGLDPRNATRK